MSEQKNNNSGKRPAPKKTEDINKAKSNDDLSEKLKRKKPAKKKKTVKSRVFKGLIVFSIFAFMYLVFVFSDNAFITKWRTIYIETAMTTNSHQWLATWFIPHDIIDQVMNKYHEGQDEQLGLESAWGDGSDKRFTDLVPDDEQEFYKLYHELASDSFRQYLLDHPDVLANGYKKIFIEDLDGELEIYTAQGDKVLVVDVENNLMIIGVKGEGYQGKMAIVKDSKQVVMAKATTLGSFGQEIDRFCKDNDAILGINASGFSDPGGVGTGAEVKGCLVIDGKDYGKHNDKKAWKFIGIDKRDERMYISNYYKGIEENYRWGMEFYPCLIINGKSVIDGTYGMGIQPRTALGQHMDGTTFLLIIDGRQKHSLGCTVEECKNILMRYGCYQAMNLDGGSSSVMYYRGQFITKPSSVSKRGRYMPNAILLKAAKDVE
ncbi:MAG: phosphodiester glycosidase family protein [Lachnospiraceae bacterium]|nr:phosphodiester glycosidase family protein [Lachnospiraceae bacterium]